MPFPLPSFRLRAGLALWLAATATACGGRSTIGSFGEEAAAAGAPGVGMPDVGTPATAVVADMHRIGSGQVCPSRASECTPGFTLLFDGTSQAGWVFIGGGKMIIQDGYAETAGDGRNLGLWYYAAREYTDFVLKLEFRQRTLSSNSRVFVRFPDPQGDVLAPIGGGYEVQIANQPGRRDSTGAIYDIQAAEAQSVLLPAGTWNDLEIQAIRQTYDVTLNGQLINTFSGRRRTS